MESKPKFKKSYFFIGIFLLAFCFAVMTPDFKITIEKIENKFLSFVSSVGGEDNWTIDGDLVYFEDDRAFLSAFPHTVSSSQWVYFNLTSYNQSGNIDAVWGFKGDSVKPKRAEYWTNYSHPNIPIYGNVTKSKDCHGTYEINYNTIDESHIWCNDSVCLETSDDCYWEHYFEHNAINDSGIRIFWNETEIVGYEDSYYYDWKDISNKFTSENWDYKNMTKWWLLKNVSIQKDKNYQIRAWVDVPISLSGVNGKYFWAIKPTNMDFQTAKDEGYFYDLDPWYSSSWTYKKNITINHSKVDGSQTNFPVLINLTDTDLITKAQPDADDIVFTNSTGSQLDHEIEFYNGTTGFLVAWVRIPTLSNTSDTTINMYYGNAGAVNQENPTGVWDDNFVMVQHMQETPTASINDSTSNNNDGTTSGMDSADQVAGQIDGSLDFDGGDYVDCGQPYNPTTQLSMSGWMKYNGATSYPRLFGVEGKWILYTITSAHDLWFYGSGIDARFPNFQAIDDGSWHFVGMVYDGDGIEGFVDGVSAGSIAKTGNLTDIGAVPFTIANRVSGGRHFNGTIDEVRISNVARTAGWIETEYNNQFSPDSFYTVGGEEEESAGDTTYPFNSTWNTSIAGVSGVGNLTLPLESTGNYDFVVNWGDGNNSSITAWDSINKTHKYATAGVYNVSISGIIQGFRFNNEGDKLKIIDISQWGVLNVGNSNGYFSGCSNLYVSATDSLNLTGTTNLYAMFYSASAFNQDISNWDVSSVTDIGFMFGSASAFNQNISNWDVSSVTNMNYTFRSASAFNQNISNWDVSSVTNMDAIFYSASAFNQDISNWDVSSVTSMYYMFGSASAFNQNISNWDVSSVTNMYAMFSYAPLFNQNLGNWNISLVTDMSYMFYNITLSTTNYNNLLIGWAELTPNLQNAITFHGGNSKYNSSNSVIARNDTLIGIHNWIITDGGYSGFLNCWIETPGKLAIPPGCQYYTNVMEFMS